MSGQWNSLGNTILGEDEDDMEWWYGMMIWMMISNDEKREMELMNDYSNWKRERNGKNEWWKERNRGDE